MARPKLSDNEARLRGTRRPKSTPGTPPAATLSPSTDVNVYEDTIRRLRAAGTLTDALLPVVKAYAESVAAASAARAAYQVDPVVPGSRGRPKTNPVLYVAREHEREAARLAVQLGLDSECTQETSVDVLSLRSRPPGLSDLEAVLDGWAIPTNRPYRQHESDRSGLVELAIAHGLDVEYAG